MTNRPFELFDAPLTDASGYVGRALCDLCNSEAEDCFSLDGADLFTPCPKCQDLVHLNSKPPIALKCERCAFVFDGPTLPEEANCCSDCFSGGRAAVTVDTELGMVRWEDAVDGWTHGLPGFKSEKWETSEPNKDGWTRIRVPSEFLLKLVRTPQYVAIQGECWLFCCHQPMVFLGVWSRERFVVESADGQGSALLDQYLGEHVPGLWEDELHDVTGIYVFQCQKCGGRRANWDIA